jgi:hypothetical protein
MKTLDHETDPDTRAVIDSVMTGKPLAPEAAQRIHEKARAIRERVFREHGLVDIGTIRDFRGPLPDA